MAGPGAAAVRLVSDEAPVAAAPLTVRPDRRKFRTGDDGESAGGSEAPQPDAAGETDGESAEGGRPGGIVAEPDEPIPEGPGQDGRVPRDAEPDGEAHAASSLAGFAAPDETGAEGPGPKLTAGDADDLSPVLSGASWPG